VKRSGGSRHQRQAGYTLIELIIAAAIGAILMTGLTSVVLTSVRAANVATSRIEASSQTRAFQLDAYDDFALSWPPAPNGCAGTIANPCSVQPISLQGLRLSNSPSPTPNSYSVTYSWDGVQFVNRQVNGGTPVHAASDVSAFSWYLDGSAPFQTVVVSMTVTVQSYSESQTFRFNPRVK
jgi:prepilin-type N-terminal cleavage/methylation domain-containing protein